MVGAGIMGASTALALRDRGHSVTIFDQFPMAHKQGSSHGRSRIVRKAYVDSFFTRIMVEGYPMWRKLQERLSEEILHETGLVFFAKTTNPDYANLTAALRENGVGFSEFNRDSASGVFPDLSLQSDEMACYSKDGGWVRADRAVSGTLRLAEGAGAVFVQKHIPEPLELQDDFDQVVVCAGPWSKSLFSLAVQPTLQTFAYLQLSHPRSGPVWIHGDDDNVYGFPSEPGTNTVKFGVHSPGPDLNPDEPERPLVESHLDILRNFARDRFGVENPVLQEPTSCVYTRTLSEDFLWGRADDRLHWVSPCSGHGFKFGPWIGQRMADMAEGKLNPADEPRFDFAKNVGQP